MSNTRVGVLLSGRGTNAQALLDACAEPDFPAEVSVVISNRRDAQGLERARAMGVPAVWVPHRKRTREAFTKVRNLPLSRCVGPTGRV